MKPEALLFDCGGVVVAPTVRDWMLPPETPEILGPDFIARRLEDFKAAKKGLSHLLPDCMRMFSDREEYEQLMVYYPAVFEKMGLAVSREAVDRLARAQAFGNERYFFFDDVMPGLEKWSREYRLGFISDAPPSLRRIIDVKGYLRFAQACAISCEVGHTKPHPAMYEAALAQLHLAPEKALFVDDLPKNLEGARRLGIQTAQMRRDMPEGFDPAPLWDGYVVHSFRELDDLLKTL